MSRPNRAPVENAKSTPPRLYLRLYFGRRLWGERIAGEIADGAAVFAQGAPAGALLMGAAHAALALLIGGGR